MKELIEYLERKIELCTEMNMPLEKFAYTDALKKARALQLQQGGVIKSLPDYELEFCEKCFQMTNHLNNKCQKCKGNVL